MIVNNYEIKPRADLRGANLREANLRGADLYGANLRGARLYRANLSRANLYGANLYGANLSRANLYGADLREANLYGANLSGANLREADLSGANLSEANLSEANLYGANLRGAKGIMSFVGEKDLLVYFYYNSEHYFKIGCKTLPYKEWLKNYKEIGKDNNYTNDEIELYGSVIKLFSKYNLSED